MSDRKSKLSWRQRISSKFGSQEHAASGADIRPASIATLKANSVSTPAEVTAAHKSSLGSDGPSRCSQPQALEEMPATEMHAPCASSVASAQSENSFWTRGYLQKKLEQPDLILAFEALIADEAAGSDKPQPGPASVAAGLWNKVLNRGGEIKIQTSKQGHGEYFVCSPEQFSAFVENRIQRTKSNDDWKVPLSQIHINLQANVRTVVRGVLWAKDALTPIMSLEPHASVVWAGICLMMPLLCNPLEQGDMLVDGLTKITSAMCRLTVTERLFRAEYGDKRQVQEHDVQAVIERYEMESAGLLADIIEYQARVACQTCRGPLSHYVRDVIKADDWKAILARVTEADNSCSKLARTLNEQKYDSHQRLLEDSLRNLDKLAAELTDVSKLTLKEVQNISIKLDDQKIQSILEALDVATYEKHKRVVPKHVKGTCRWFIENPQFIRWKAAQSDVLWLAADPGCGKTVLSRYLVEEEISSNTERTTCYFFFRDGMAEQQGIERTLCALLHQLFTQKRGLARHAMKFYNALGKALAKSADSLWDVLVNASRDPSAGEVVFVIDALDECEESDRKDLVQRVSDLYLPSQSGARGRAKFLLTSRPYYDINVSFQELIDELPNVHLSADQETAAIRREIDIVVDHRVAALALTLKLRASTADMLSKKLKAADNRTYLWLRLIFHAIEKRHGATKRDLELLIETIPDTVQKAYADILAQCVDPPKARRIFELLLASQIPLTVQELNIAVALSEARVDDSEHDDESEEEEMEIIPHAIFREQVRYVCGLFVAIIDDKVYFIHQTAREFLTMEPKKSRQDADIALPLKLPACHFTMATACASCILTSGTATKGPDLGAFMAYACRFWDMHVAMAVLAGDQSTFAQLYAQTLNICSLLDVWWPFRHPTAQLGGEVVDEEKQRSSQERDANDSAANDDMNMVGIADSESSAKSVPTIEVTEALEPYPGTDLSLSIGEPSQSQSTIAPKAEIDARTQAFSEVVCLAFFGLAASLWLSCVYDDKHKRESPQHKHQAMLQWAWTQDSGSNAERVQLWISEQNPKVDSPNRRQRGQSIRKILWESSHFANLAQDTGASIRTSAATNDLFTIAKKEAKLLIDSFEKDANDQQFADPRHSIYFPDCGASQTVLAEAFSVPAHSVRSSYGFQQYLRRAGGDGLLWETEFIIDTGKLLLRAPYGKFD